ncbi:hypothetical protein OROMI_030783 [Orobanche minor]
MTDYEVIFSHLHIYMASQFIIDLNQSPPIYDDESHNEEAEIPITTTYSSLGASSDSLAMDIMVEQISDTDTTTITNCETREPEERPQIDEAIAARKKMRILTDAERWAIYRALLEKSINGKLDKNTTKEVQHMFNIENVRTIQRIWKIHKRTPSGTNVDVSSRKRRSCGRKRLEVDLSRVPEIELHKRTTVTSLSNALGVSYSKVYNLFKEGVIRRHSSAIKPHLKEENKISRLQFCLSMLEESPSSNDPKSKGMYNYVHIDEKWFYMTKKDQTYYLLAIEGDPDRSCQSKNFIEKVMFLAATARPRFDDNGRLVFDGKIGCWPFVTEQPAQRNSRNRQAETYIAKVD